MSMINNSNRLNHVEVSQYLCYQGMPVLRKSKRWPGEWPCDTDGNIIFVKIPPTINLSSSVKQEGYYGGPTGIASLPPELHWNILQHLIPVDRASLGLTCKSLAASVNSSPRISSVECLSLVDCGYRFYITQRDHLIQRLAHGWVDKQKFRYCWKCRHILPRNEAFFQKRLQRKKMPSWNGKVGMSKENWQSLSKKKRYQHLIKLWCEADWEDTSSYACATCRPQYIDNCRESIIKFVEKSQPLGSYQAPPICNATQCPKCLEEELTFKFKIPRKKVCRPLMWKVLNVLWNIVSSIVLIFLYAIIIIIEAPWKFGKKAWKKYLLGYRLRRFKAWLWVLWPF